MKLGIVLAGACLVFFTGCSDTKTNTKTYNKPYNNNYGRNFSPKPYSQPSSDAFYASQLDAIRRTRYKKRKVMNQSESDLFDALLSFKIAELGYVICAQTSFGAFLAHDDKDLYLQVCNKRADFCLIDIENNPVMVIEYNGEGHYQSESSKRDDIKELVCSGAGIPFVKIFFHEKEDNFKHAIETKVMPQLLIKKS